VPVPGVLLLVFALLGGVLRALQLMIKAPAPGCGEAARQLLQGPPLSGFDPRGPTFTGAAQ
jgi:hypothetical protein